MNEEEDGTGVSKRPVTENLYKSNKNYSHVLYTVYCVVIYPRENDLDSLC